MAHPHHFVLILTSEAALYPHYYSFVKVFTTIKNKNDQDEDVEDNKGQGKGNKEADKQDNGTKASHAFLEKARRIRYKAL